MLGTVVLMLGVCCALEPLGVHPYGHVRWDHMLREATKEGIDAIPLEIDDLFKMEEAGTLNL